MVIKAALVDVGGVCVGSPITGANDAEKLWGLPPHYINAHITAQGEGGAFQRLERGELPLETFYRQFGAELSNVETGNRAYRAYCQRTGRECPKLPTSLKIDGKELWMHMMKPALTPDPVIIAAINALRTSNKFRLAALTNNFVVPGAAVPPPQPIPSWSTLPPRRAVPFELLSQSLQEAAANPDSAGAPTELLKGMFDLFIESSVEKLRKPDPAFYQLALDRLGVKAEETVFLDDIGPNLAAAKKLGIHTIRVLPGRSIEAVKELEKVVGIPLRAELVAAKL
ncbi:HAD-like domain-containing protein [Leucosporidium creatinivorum]|uniref:HAD-like domain-containing protein n=1 Tax=Leucosporidium creatinivorum TaxID=106004 RepID=A0A1Y2DG77_9BASI|nr:HAD-like domain-containing protein [Leucosporidium creatinivorum]